MNKLMIKYLKKLLTHLEYYNNMAPFPPYDTDYVKEVTKTIKSMENSSINYDELPVVCCSHCKSLHVVVDDEMNEICNRCNSINELEVLDDIEAYQEKYGNIWK